METMRATLIVFGLTAAIALADPVDSWRSGTGGDVSADPELSAQALAWCSAVYRVNATLSQSRGDTTSAGSYTDDADAAITAAAAALFFQGQGERRTIDLYSSIVSSWVDEHFSTMISRLRRIDRSNPRSVERGVRTLLGNMNKCAVNMSEAQSTLLEAARQIQSQN